MSHRKVPQGEFELTVDNLADDGRGVGRVNGKAVFVDSALPGETVRFRYRRRRSRMDEGELLEVLNPSSQRVVPECAHFGVCGGCSLQHLDAEQQILRKQDWLLESLKRIGGVSPQNVLDPVHGPLWHYRRRARLGVKDVPGKGRVLVGFRERRAPYLAEMSSCDVLDQRAGQLLIPLSQLVGSLSLRRRIPQIDVAAGDDTLALGFRVLDTPLPEDLDKLRNFARQHALQVYLQPGGDDTLKALEPVEPAPLSYRLPTWDLELEFLPGHFVQVNGAVNESMVALALQLLAPSPQSLILDLYCGLGNFSLTMARSCAEVLGIEGSQELVHWAAHNAKRNNIQNARFEVADLTQSPIDQKFELGKFDRVLLDPPRSGATEAIDWIGKFRPERIVYVSCHPGTLARDAGTLVSEFGYRLDSAGVLDMFPHTTHVESIALFVR